MFGLGPMEIGIIAVIFAILFGAGNLPKFGKGMGQMITNFKREMKELEKLDEAPRISKEPSGNDSSS